jgi:hypothetical protein
VVFRVNRSKISVSAQLLRIIYHVLDMLGHAMSSNVYIFCKLNLNDQEQNTDNPWHVCQLDDG